MGTIERANELLKNAEAGLRDLVGEAAKAGDYEAVRVLTDGAEALASLAARLSTQTTTCASGATPRSAESERAGGVVAGAAAVGKPRRKPPLYPKFFRRGDELVKVGYSKRGRREYQHKTPRKVVSLVAAAITKAAVGKRLVAADDFMPVVDPADGNEIPGYQVYVCLAWMRKEGLIKQDGRQGYTLSKERDLAANVPAAWERLPEA
ncbi:MAG TPA: hypothetical protein VGP72_00615 [Planctomycetota bacterium]|jgi:hypothetical protein